VYFKRFHFEATLKREVIIYTVEHGNRTGCKFTISKANVRRRIDLVSIVSWKVATKEFTGPKKKRNPNVDVEVLHFVRETRAKWMTTTWQAVQVKATETAKPFGITNFKCSARFVQEMCVP
jgi:hypothetical protein